MRPTYLITSFDSILYLNPRQGRLICILNNLCVVILITNNIITSIVNVIRIYY